MKNKLRNIFALSHYVMLMGLKWFLFRLKYEGLKKIHYFDWLNRRILNKYFSKDQHSFYYKRIGLVNHMFKGTDSFLKKAEQAIEKKIFAFSHEYLDYNDQGIFNWQMNPKTKKFANGSLPWNQLPDFGHYGDIKLIWEASRFPQIYYFINAYAVSNDEKYAYQCIEQIIKWCDENPYPLGVNYKCGQEISFRIFAWIMALEFFSTYISKEDECKIVANIYISLLRVDANIDYAVESVKNNHSISEAAGLFIGGLLFPQFRESKLFVQKGLTCLLSETAYQIYNDGSYIQHSFIYQRLVLDVLSFVMVVAKKKDYELPLILKQRHHRMIQFLNSFIQETGWLPNYGANDGSNLFPLTGDDYRDFRSSLNFASVVNCGSSLFIDYQTLIDFFMLKSLGVAKLDTKIEFPNGGYYILKNSKIFSFIRCHSYKDRPSQNDMLHLDIWFEGKNIFCDAGSYSYNIDERMKNNFIGVIGHNTIAINHTNHMKKVLNFGYSNWTKAQCIKFLSNKFVGEHYAYKNEFSIVVERSVNLEENRIVVIDALKNLKRDTYIQQIWNTKFEVHPLDENTLRVDNCIINVNGKYRIEENYISDYYGCYVIGNRIIIECNAITDTRLETILHFEDF